MYEGKSFAVTEYQNLIIFHWGNYFLKPTTVPISVFLKGALSNAFNKGPRAELGRRSLNGFVVAITLVSITLQKIQE